MSDEMAIIVSLFSGVIGSILTVGGTNYMSATKDKKQKGEELIPRLNIIKERLNEISSTTSYNDEKLQSYYKDFQYDRGSIETILKFYFGKTTLRKVQLFLNFCEGVHLKVEMDYLGKDIDLQKKAVEEQMEQLLRTESSQTELEDEEKLTLVKVKEFMEKQTEIEKMKIELKSTQDKIENNMIRNIENKYRVRKTFDSDSLNVLLEKTNQSLEYAIHSIRNDYKLNNRIKLM